MESVFSALFGWIILKETLSARELTGCTVMFLAILTAEMPFDGLPFMKARGKYEDNRKNKE